MKKRMRKKLHLSELCEDGVEFDPKVSSSFSEEALDALIDIFIQGFLERNGLYCGGGWNPKETTKMTTRGLFALF